MMGPWSVSPAQKHSVRGIFEGILELMRADVQLNWGRGCKSWELKIDTFNDCSVFLVVLINTIQAQEVQPDSISLPSTAAITDLSLHLSYEQNRALVSESGLVLPESECPSPPPRPCLIIRPDVEQMLRKSWCSVVWVPSFILESHIATCFRGRKLIAELFIVPHRADSDRLIVDRRLQNAIEARMRWATLPHGSLLCQLHPQPDEDVRGSRDDVSNVFYLLRRSRETAGRYAFGYGFSREDAKQLGGDPGMMYHLCLSTLAMADLNSVDVAQAVHENVLREA